MTRSLTLLALSALAVTAAACGKQGALERPAPLWDAQKKAAWQAERRAASAQANQPARAGGRLLHEVNGEHCGSERNGADGTNAPNHQVAKLLLAHSATVSRTCLPCTTRFAMRCTSGWWRTTQLSGCVDFKTDASPDAGPRKHGDLEVKQYFPDDSLRLHAIREAALMRFRPIMMTTFAAIFGTLPIALGAGAGAELRQPLGVSVVGGLLVSQLLTLFITPVIYIYLDRIDRRLKRRLDPTLQDTPDVEPPRVAAAE